MITLRKLSRLPPSTRIRKIIRLLDGFVQYQHLPARDYLAGLAELVEQTMPDTVEPLSIPEDTSSTTYLEVVIRRVDTLRHEMRLVTGESTGDWDLLPPAGFGAPRQPEPPDPRGEGRSASPVSVYMESIRSPFNAGSIIRSAAALGATRVGMSPDCPPADHPRLLRTALGAERLVQVHRLPLSALSEDWQPLLALETGGRPLSGYRFPGRGTLLVGSEELGLSAAALAAATDRISIDMSTSKGSLNVGVACGIALHAWLVRVRPGD